MVGNIITALTSNTMIAPSFWIDPKNRQRLHADGAVSGDADQHFGRSARDSGARAECRQSTRLDAVAEISRINSPTEVDHYGLRRAIDIYVQPLGEDLGRIAKSIDKLKARTKFPTA